MSITVKVDLKGMNLIEPKVRAAIKTGLEKTGRRIERDAKIRAPVDTGRLRASIFPTVKGHLLTVQDNVFYGIYQELGTRKMRPHPFMKPALLANIPNIIKDIQSEVKRILK